MFSLGVMILFVLPMVVITWALYIPWMETTFPGHRAGVAFWATVVSFLLGIGVISRFWGLKDRFPTITKVVRDITYWLFCVVSLLLLGSFAVIGMSPSFLGILIPLIVLLLVLFGMIRLVWMAEQWAARIVKCWGSSRKSFKACLA